MTADRMYAALLWLYPESFREEYGREMLAAFQQIRTSTRRSAPAFWAFVAADLARSSLRAWLDCWRQPQQRIVLRFMLSSVIGFATTVAAAHVTTVTYRYFYHPYLEGVEIPVLPYGAALGLVLGLSVAVAQWALLPARVRRASGWALASAVALPVAVLFCSAAIDRAIAGFNPLSAERHLPTLDVFVVGLDRLPNWSDIALQFGAMTASALAVRSLLRKPLMERRHAH
jgi:hypothetical protein